MDSAGKDSMVTPLRGTSTCERAVAWKPMRSLLAQSFASDNDDRTDQRFAAGRRSQ